MSSKNDMLHGQFILLLSNDFPLILFLFLGHLFLHLGAIETHFRKPPFNEENIHLDDGSFSVLFLGYIYIGTQKTAF